MEKPELITDLELVMSAFFERVEIRDIKQRQNLFRSQYSIDDSNNIIALTFLLNANLKQYSTRIGELLKKYSETLKHNLIYLELSFFYANNIDFLEKLKNLRYLKMFECSAGNISTISNLENLSELEIVNCKIYDISSIGKLLKLTYINITRNLVCDISPINNLQNLRYLNLTKNKISKIPLLNNLNNLLELYLSSNEIEDITNLASLKNLRTLEIRSNKIKNITSLKGLVKLENLMLDKNLIEDISCINNLKNLNVLDLRFNKIKQLPNWIGHFSRLFILWVHDRSLKSLNLYGNPLESPPIEIIKGGREAVNEWFTQQNKYGREKVYEAKVVIVGEPGAGKTSLVKKILDEKYPIPRKTKEKSTLGVEVQTIIKFVHPDKIPIETNFWDFGGQAIQYTLHQYFISPESLYVLVSDYREEKSRFNYWLQTINMLGSNQSQVIIVLNKFRDVTSVVDFDITPYKRDFPKLDIHAIEVDLSQNDIRWYNLKKLITERLCKLPVVGQEGIKIWNIIRNTIEGVNKDYIDLDEFMKLAFNKGMDNEDDVIFMLEYFHKIGIVIFFKDDPSLRREVFINPNWITRAIYDVLSDKNSEHINGQFDKKWLFNYWKNKGYNFNEQGMLLNLMQKNKLDLCYPLPDSENKFIVPILLPVKEPKYSWDKKRNIHLRYMYDQFMPEGIVSQLIVKVHEYIAIKDQTQFVWNKGVLLEREDTQAEIIEHTNGREIHIRLQGPYTRELRGIIYDNLKKIIDRYPEKPIIEFPCICSTCRELDEPYFFKHTNILDRIRKGNKNAGECENSYEVIKIAELYDGEVMKDFVLDGIDTIYGMIKGLKFEQKKANEKLYDELKIHESKSEKRNNTLIEIINTQYNCLITILFENNSKLDKTEIDIKKLENLIQIIEMKDESTILIVVDEIIDQIDNSIKLHEAIIDEKLQDIYQNLKKSNNPKTKLKLSIPFLNVLGIQIEKEVYVKNFFEGVWDRINR